MKYLNTIKDNVINKDYDLYLINAKEINAILVKAYRLSEHEIQQFNEASGTPEAMKKIKEENEIGKRLNKKPCSDLKEYENIVNNPKINISEYGDFVTSFGYELMPIAVCAKNKDMLSSDIELLDGFKRMFFVSDVPNIDILVKVYDLVSDSEWINLMISFNSWKFANDVNSRNYLDRGFRLGLFKRFGINFLDYNFPNRYYSVNTFTTIDIYTDNSKYAYRNRNPKSSILETLWNNDKFADDLIFMLEMITYLPKFKYSKKIKGEIKNFEVDSALTYGNDGITDCVTIFVKYIGAFRRYENREQRSGNPIERKTFKLDDFIGFMTNPEFQKDFIRMSEMTVGGHIENFVYSHFKEIIRNIIDPEDYMKKKRNPNNEIKKTPIGFNDILI